MNPVRAFRALPLIAMALLATSAQGQDRLLAPLNATAPVPHSAYQSVLSDYRSNLDPQPVAWRTVNDMVGQIGGHAGHAGHNMGQAKPAAPSANVPAATKPATPANPAKSQQPSTPDAAHQHKH